MIETKRLILKPLTYAQMLKYIKNDNSLESELQLNSASLVISPLLKEALEQSILPSLKDENRNYLFSTLWTVIDKLENRSVADICFQGEPNEQGEIEIGYGTYEQHQGKGYMTEALSCMLTWAEQQAKVKAVIASTDKTNVASYTVLEKNAFEKISESEEQFHWRLTFS
ncbi:GNAT family N-acetyltransferase [Paraglaciecola sp.]|uniref:GNAT family N-acetyltransferase n=1 Tax=Paraglaciecola sp. TaxID=1920173 RepID=UPI0030F41BAE